jgi:hypothetical protein
MAGSYNHITTAKGKFRGTQLIDNLGDAYEALEECYGMIWALAHGWDAQLQQDRGVGPRSDEEEAADIAALVEEARENYQAGLQYSPGRNAYAKRQGASIPGWERP